MREFTIKNLKVDLEQKLKNKIDFMPELRQFEKLEMSRAEYVKIMEEYVLCLLDSYRLNNDDVQTACTNIVENITQITRDEIRDKTGLNLHDDHIVEIQDQQISSFRYIDLKLQNDVNDCNPSIRIKHCTKLISIWSDVMKRIDAKWEPENIPKIFEENQIVENGFVPPASYGKSFRSGMDFSDAEDPATRKSYQEYNDKMQRFSTKASEQINIRKVRRMNLDFVKRFLIDAYSLPPYRASELEMMLKDNKVDEAMSKEILAAVRNAEKERPDDGFRIWRSSDKLFKAEAKFISTEEIIVNGKQVDQKITLE
ncbi:MAG: hypothetical protein LBH59_09620, partial [Planctomycetaceae bacterium]|nr:hypothetical protein [Planctomycetaceae bacterium]